MTRPRASGSCTKDPRDNARSSCALRIPPRPGSVFDRVPWKWWRAVPARAEILDEDPSVARLLDRCEDRRCEARILAHARRELHEPGAAPSDALCAAAVFESGRPTADGARPDLADDGHGL